MSWQVKETRLMDALADLWQRGYPERFVDVLERNLFYATGQTGWQVTPPAPEGGEQVRELASR